MSHVTSHLLKNNYFYIYKTLIITP